MEGYHLLGVVASLEKDLVTVPTNVSQPTNEPLELMQESRNSCSQDHVTRTRREPARLMYYAPGQSLHCQQNFVDASIYRPLFYHLMDLFISYLRPYNHAEYNLASRKYSVCERNFGRQ